MSVTKLNFMLLLLMLLANYYSALMILSSYILNCISFSLTLDHYYYFLSFIAFIPHHLCYFNHINKLNGVHEFDSEIGYTTYCNGYLG